ncbi:hypothetical protein LTR28_012809, partial [Elasticomyces elasticus]
KLGLQWSTQDLKCGRCARLRTNDFMEHCSCAGEWVGTVKKEELTRKIRVFGNVAEFYGLRMLGDVVRSVSDGL